MELPTYFWVGQKLILTISLLRPRIIHEGCVCAGDKRRANPGVHPATPSMRWLLPERQSPRELAIFCHPFVATRGRIAQDVEPARIFRNSLRGLSQHPGNDSKRRRTI